MGSSNCDRIPPVWIADEVGIVGPSMICRSVPGSIKPEIMDLKDIDILPVRVSFPDARS